MRKIKLAVGADGRNRTVLWPFKSKTSRTQPKASQWIFSPAVWLRSLAFSPEEFCLAELELGFLRTCARKKSSPTTDGIFS